MQIIMMSFAFFAFHVETFCESALIQAQLPISLGTINDAAKPSLEFGGGIGADAFLWSYNSFILGLGGGLYGTMPFKTGNASVRVKPYAIYAEERISLGYVFKANVVSIVPTLALKSETGVRIYKRHVQESSSMNAAWLLALGPSLSVFYWIKKMGFGMSYSLSYGNQGLRQHFDLALLLMVPV